MVDASDLGAKTGELTLEKDELLRAEGAGVTVALASALETTGCQLCLEIGVGKCVQGARFSGFSSTTLFVFGGWEE